MGRPFFVSALLTQVSDFALVDVPARASLRLVFQHQIFGSLLHFSFLPVLLSSTLVPTSFHSPSSFVRTLFGPCSGVIRSSSEQGPNEVRMRDEGEWKKSKMRVEGEWLGGQKLRVLAKQLFSIYSLLLTFV